MNENPNNNNKLVLPLVITRGLLVFPNMIESIEVSRPFSMAAIDQAKNVTNSLLFVTAQIDSAKDVLTGDGDVYLAGSLCRIISFVSQDNSDGKIYRVRVSGSQRMLLSSIHMDGGSFVATGEIIPDVYGDKATENDLARQVVKFVESNPSIGRDIPRSAVSDLTSPNGASSSKIADILGAYLPIELSERETLMAEGDVNERLKHVLELVSRQKEIVEIDAKLNDTVRERAEKSQKEYFLREKMKAIKDELGEGQDLADDESSIKEKLEKNPYPENVKSRIKSELHRYEMMPESSLEASLIMNYIDVLMNAPWYQKTEDNDDLDNVQKILDEDHYGLEKVKKRIIEYLAVKHSTGNLKAPILCFFGPPGCGKTSLGRSIARALGRKFYKASLGGISDEAEIRGHRRTYVGSMPGRIIQGMSKAGTVNPVFLLDEIDKVGASGYKGDPSSALLEVLDPEQNYAFNDNYIEEPYDLSNVLFIATANNLDNVPGPLRDRLELIEVPSYTELEKMKIADGFLVKKQMAANGLKDGDIKFTDDGIKEIIEFYTREAGVRELERLIASCCRKAVVEIIKDPNIKKPLVVDAAQVKKYLGVEIFEDTKKEKKPQIGVVTGLAYTDFGGDILPIETTYFPGKGGLVLTGKLGDVMKESAQIAVDYVRANSKKYGIADEIFQKNDIHIHFPEGAVPKDGPSAGVAITTAIISCLTHSEVDNNVAMTGEVTLRGKALPIGGLREKSLAALRSGIKTIIVPEDNRKDVSELPSEVKKDLKIVFMKDVDDAVKVAILPKGVA
ncbi:MAG: endopeptidase La [Bacilli bacterium]|jgi:ATP-dependent Lon protease|nr:endopeptidase La [Bacilli bacterium]MCH4211142.1 endopeptidase La [Bacilli bacterium]MCH4228310.1 endopeptidase La [Bacilli bacterium]MCH4277341.1 endopeptidase La [Bacilli bacterium]MCI2055333.1 endopeptidase La [Bacilli bacterium]